MGNIRDPNLLRRDFPETEKDLMLKILVVGDTCVGKTSIIKRYKEGCFIPDVGPTIGMDFAVKRLQWNKTTNITLQLWDIAGEEKAKNLTRVYYKNANAALVVFDITRPDSYQSITRWIQDVHEKTSLENGDHIPMVVLAHKCDNKQTKPQTEELNDFCYEHGLLGWFPASAKDNINIDEAVYHVVREIMNQKLEGEALVNNNTIFPETVQLREDDPKKQRSKCCATS